VGFGFGLVDEVLRGWARAPAEGLVTEQKCLRSSRLVVKLLPHRLQVCMNVALS
jgi:hypothetical protein